MSPFVALVGNKFTSHRLPPHSSSAIEFWFVAKQSGLYSVPFHMRCTQPSEAISGPFHFKAYAYNPGEEVPFDELQLVHGSGVVKSTLPEVESDASCDRDRAAVPAFMSSPFTAPESNQRSANLSLSDKRVRCIN